VRAKVRFFRYKIMPSSQWLH